MVWISFRTLEMAWIDAGLGTTRYLKMKLTEIVHPRSPTSALFISIGSVAHDEEIRLYNTLLLTSIMHRDELRLTF